MSETMVPVAPSVAGMAIVSRFGESDTAVGRLESSPIHLLHRACQCAGDIFQREIDERELTPRQYAILLTVSQNEGLSQTHLVEKTGIDRSTLADVVRRMLKKGLLRAYVANAPRGRLSSKFISLST